MKNYLKVIVTILIIILISACGKEEKVEVKTVDINKTKEIAFYNLKFELPDVYVESDYSSEDYLVYSTKDSNYDLSGCEFGAYIYETAIYDDEDYEEIDNSSEGIISNRLLEELYKTYTINHKTINGQDWTYASAENISVEGDEKFVTGVYVTDYNDVKYVFTYDDALFNKGTCKTLIDNVLNSLNLTK